MAICSLSTIHRTPDYWLRGPILKLAFWALLSACIFMKFICFNITPIFLSNFCMHCVSDLSQTTDSRTKRIVYSVQSCYPPFMTIFSMEIMLLQTTNGWKVGTKLEELDETWKLSVQSIKHCAQHLLLICTKYQTFVPKWWILSVLLSDIWWNISQICSHLYWTSHPILRGSPFTSNIPIWKP